MTCIAIKLTELQCTCTFIPRVRYGMGQLGFSQRICISLLHWSEYRGNTMQISAKILGLNYFLNFLISPLNTVELQWLEH